MTCCLPPVLGLRLAQNPSRKALKLEALTPQAICTKPSAESEWRRPFATRETLSFSPLVQARGADASSIERVPLVSAVAKPFVFFAGRPAAERAPDARGFRFARLLLFAKLAIHNDRFRGVGHNGTSSHTVDRFTGGCLRVIMSTATHAPKTTSDAKQKPGHHCGTPGLSMKK